jgi:hypothetical protein
MPRRRQNWDNLVRTFKDSPDAAYRFARAMYLAQHGLTREQGAMIDELIEALYPYTDFYSLSSSLLVGD